MSMERCADHGKAVANREIESGVCSRATGSR
jgi:hypothetical protein